MRYANTDWIKQAAKDMKVLNEAIRQALENPVKRTAYYKLKTRLIIFFGG